MGTKVFDNALDLITFTRASGGTALRRIGYGPELVTNGTFDTDTSGWSSFGPEFTSFTVNAFAGRLVTSKSIGTSGVRQVLTGLTAGNTYVLSGRLRVVGGGHIASIRWANGDVTSGYTLLSSTTSASFEDVVASFTPSGTTATIFLINGGSGSASATYTTEYDNISVKEFFFDRASDPLVLFNHPTNIPRIEYDASGAVKGLLIEQARTNLLTYSEQFDNAAWTKTNATVTANATVSPDGETTADKLVAASGVSTHFLTRTISVTSGVTQTFSVYAKKAEKNWLRLAAQATFFTTPNHAWFDLDNGVVGTVEAGTSATIEAVGNGWYRCAWSRTAVSSGAPGFYVVVEDADATISFDGDGTSGIYVWGAQLEAGALLTSYIRTAGATATRSEDIASIPVSAFGYNQKAGTVVVEFETKNTSNVNVLRLGTKSSYDDGLDLAVTSGSLDGAVWFNNTKVASYNGASVSANTSYKMAATVKPNDVQFAVGGSTSGVDTNASINPAVTLLIGDKDQNSLYGLCLIKSIAYYPRRLTNTQLQDLTS